MIYPEQKPRNQFVTEAEINVNELYSWKKMVLDICHSSHDYEIEQV